MIQPFEISENLKQKGFTGKIIAKKIFDKIYRINRKIGELEPEVIEFTVGQEELQDNLELKVVGFSIGHLFKYIAESFGFHQNCIRGEVVFYNDDKDGKNDKLKLTIRPTSTPQKTIFGKLSDLDTILNNAAEYFYENTAPYTWALYQYSKYRKFHNDEYKEEALTVVKRIISENSASITNINNKAYNLWGNILYDRKDYEGAIEKYKKAVRIPGFAIAYFNWGRALYSQNKQNINKAIKKFEEAIDIDSKCAPAYLSWGDVLYDQGKYKEAISKYRKVLQFSERYALAYYNWGLALAKQKKYNDAAQKYGKVIEIKPDDVDSRIELYNVLSAQNKKDQAKRIYDEAIERDPSAAIYMK